MRDNTANFLSFIGGFALGAGIMWVYMLKVSERAIEQAVSGTTETTCDISDIPAEEKEAPAEPDSKKEEGNIVRIDDKFTPAENRGPADDDEPRIVTPDEADSEECETYARVVCYWYGLTGHLITEEGDELTIEDSVGLENLRGMSPDNFEILIRNDRYSTIYDVIFREEKLDENGYVID